MLNRVKLDDWTEDVSSSSFMAPRFGAAVTGARDEVSIVMRMLVGACEDQEQLKVPASTWTCPRGRVTFCERLILSE